MIDASYNKNLQVNDKIIFIIGNTSFDGTIIEKNYIGRGDIDFVITTSDNKTCRVKHRLLNLLK
jgi:hypothetical protein